MTAKTIQELIRQYKIREAFWAAADGVENDTQKQTLFLQILSFKNNVAILQAHSDILRQEAERGEEEETEKVLNKETGEYEYKKTGINVFGGTGLAWRLNDIMTKSISTVSSYAGTTADTDDDSYLGKLITNLQTKMSNFKTMMSAFEEQLYKKYDSLEIAIQRLSVQLSTVTGFNNQG